MINSKIRLPIGMHRWKNIFNLSEDRSKNAFTFAHACTLSTKSRNFQYKISTFTLPTQEYLWNYQVKPNYYCSRCLSSTNNFSFERDNISHNLFSCPIIAPFLSKALDFFVNECKASNQISELDYLLGIYGRGFEGLNSALLELKKFIFYNFSSEKSMNLQFSIFLSR